MRFDRAKHQLPRFTLKGEVIEAKIVRGVPLTNVLKDNISKQPISHEGLGVPEWWTDPQAEKGEPKTLTKLRLENRRRNVADPSYDLDGDGVVSGREYFIAKRFDQDQDGKLNAEERAKALAALGNGFEDNFHWNVEREGAQRGKRLLQLRGKIIDAEDFSSISETYPKHPLTDLKPHVASLQELRAKRKQWMLYVRIVESSHRQEFSRKKDEWDHSHPLSIPQPFVASEFLIENPRFRHLSNPAVMCRCSKSRASSRPKREKRTVWHPGRLISRTRTRYRRWHTCRSRRGPTHGPSSWRSFALTM
jgi:hypothetical protein